MTHANADQPTSTLIGFTEAAAILNVTESWLRRSVTAKKIPHRRVGRVVRFSADDLDQIVADCAVPAAHLSKELRPSRRST